MTFEIIASPHTKIKKLTYLVMQKYWPNYELNDYGIRILRTLVFLSIEDVHLVNISNLVKYSQMHLNTCKKHLSSLELQTLLIIYRNPNIESQIKQIQLNWNNIAIIKCKEIYLRFSQEYQNLISRIDDLMVEI